MAAAPRVSVSRTWKVVGEGGGLGASIEQVAASHGLSVSRSGDVLELVGGSQAKMRLLGGWFVGAGTLPKAGTVTQQTSEATTTITLALRDTVGVGVMDKRLKRKYQDCLDQIARDVGSGLSSSAESCEELAVASS